MIAAVVVVAPVVVAAAAIADDGKVQMFVPMIGPGWNRCVQNGKMNQEKMFAQLLLHTTKQYNNLLQ